MNIDKQLEKMRKRLEHSRPARIMVTLANGEVIATDPVGAIILFQEREVGAIAGVTADRADYMELAGMLNALCR